MTALWKLRTTVQARASVAARMLEPLLPFNLHNRSGRKDFSFYSRRSETQSPEHLVADREPARGRVALPAIEPATGRVPFPMAEPRHAGNQEKL